MTDTSVERPATAQAAKRDTRSGPVRAVVRAPGLAERDPRRYMRRRRYIDNVLRIGTPVALVVLWQLLADAEVIDPRFWPGPIDTARAFVRLVRDGVLWDTVYVSMKRLVWGYTTGCLAGVVIGLMLGVFRYARVAFDPVISALYTIPKLALLPPLLLLFGLGETPKIILIAMSVFFIVVIGTMSATTKLPIGYLEPARSYQASRLVTFRHVVVPAVLPDIFVSLRIAAGTGVLVLVGIEFVQGNDGLGFMIWNSWQVYRVAQMYVGIVTVAIIGVIFQSLVKWIGQLVAPWSVSADYSTGKH